MKTKLSRRELIPVSTMLFGLFFGAGNLIFPVFMGQAAGRNVLPAVLGFLTTGVGIPLLAVAALGSRRSSGLQELASSVGGRYSVIFTAALYLTIGPFFAIPRCASVSFSVGVLPALADTAMAAPLRLVFSFAFFAAVLWFSLRPGKILTWVGKVLTPAFLIGLGIVLLAALLHPMGNAALVEPADAYRGNAFFKGFLEGYNTMDALAGLAFGIVIVNVIRELGVEEPRAIAVNTLRAGVLGCALMAAIYVLLALTGAQSRAIYPMSADGGEALYVIAHHYFGSAGAALLALTVTFACLKTAVGLITSCAETFVDLTHGIWRYKTWAILFCVVSFLIANLGLNAIIAYSIPALMLLYPLAISLILLALGNRLFENDRGVYVCTIVCALVAALFDFANALPERWRTLPPIETFVCVGARLPGFSLGLGWVVPALLGFGIGMLLHFRAKRKETTNHIG